MGAGAAPPATAGHGSHNLRAEMIIMMPMSSKAGRGMSERAFGAIGLGLVFLLPGLSTAVLAVQVPTEGRIFATYQVDLAGFSLGEFRLSAKFQGSSYQIEGEGRFSLFLGRTYKSSGSTESAGRFANGGIEPSSFKLSVKNGDKREARRLSFARGAVSQATFIPQKKIGKRRVPVTKDQLVDVLDPLTAAFLHMPGGAPICDATMPVYDGLLRFDLVLTPKRADQLPSEAPAGLSGPAAVCNVKFVPIGGYKPDNAAIKYLSQTDQIEAWLVRLPQTTLYVPYWIGVPTPLGRGGATLTKIKIDLD
jgi:uncharacterized protein DUF3108